MHHLQQTQAPAQPNGDGRHSTVDDQLQRLQLVHQLRPAAQVATEEATTTSEYATALQLQHHGPWLDPSMEVTRIIPPPPVESQCGSASALRSTCSLCTEK